MKFVPTLMVSFNHKINIKFIFYIFNFSSTAFGEVKSILMREHGLNKWNSEFASSIVEFESINCNILSQSHSIRSREVLVREFDSNCDVQNDDWNIDENSPKRQKLLGRKIKARYSCSSASPKKLSLFKRSNFIHTTRTVMISGSFFNAKNLDEFEKYFTSFGQVVKMTMARAKSLVFIRFKDYESAEEALGKF